MLEAAETRTPEIVPGKPPVIRWHSPAAAFASALIPGLGQLIAGENKRAAFLFVLDAVWISLFFSPLRLPDYYPGWLCLILYGVLLAITASCEALRSETPIKPAGSYFWLLFVAPAAVIVPLAAQAILLPAAGFRDYRISSDSMAPTVQKGDLIMGDMRSFRKGRARDGEIVLLRSPSDRNVILIKRIMATGGETISGRDGQIWRNGSVINEPYVQHTGGAPYELTNFGPITLPAMKLFVMGDDRDISLDSRMPEFGLVDESALLGRALYVISAAHTRDGERLP